MFRYLPLLLALIAPASFADDLYQVELILFQQEGDVVYSSQPAPDDWAKGAQPLGEDARRPPENCAAARPRSRQRSCADSATHTDPGK